jgi:hypothetical protein
MTTCVLCKEPNAHRTLCPTLVAPEDGRRLVNAECVRQLSAEVACTLETARRALEHGVNVFREARLRDRLAFVLRRRPDLVAQYSKGEVSMGAAKKVTKAKKAKGGVEEALPMVHLKDGVAVPTKRIRVQLSYVADVPEDLSVRDVHALIAHGIMHFTPRKDDAVTIAPGARLGLSAVGKKGRL